MLQKLFVGLSNLSKCTSCLNIKKRTDWVVINYFALFKSNLISSQNLLIFSINWWTIFLKFRNNDIAGMREESGRLEQSYSVVTIHYFLAIHSFIF
jgi:hypothetical protein